MKYNESTNSHDRHQGVKASNIKTDFDNVEESLRDALRHTRRVAAVARVKEDTESQMPSGEVNAHQPSRDLPKGYENVRPQGLPHSPQQNSAMFFPNMPTSGSQMQNQLTGEDFRRYCLFLTERMQKMEDQNVQLVRLAEQQKQEYNKVTAQIVHSEMMQRRLHRECSNLRRQVQQLSHYNKQLIESVPVHPSRSVMTSQDAHLTNSLLHKRREHLSRVPCNEPHRSQQKEQISEGVNGISKPVMKRLSESGFEDDLSFDAAPEDPATVVELYSALRKSPSTNNGMFEEPQGYAQRAQLMTEPSQDCILGVIPEQNEMTPRSNNSKCDPEYASPSSVCVQAACTTCGQGSESILQGNKLLDTSPRQQTVCVEPCSPQALAKTFGDDRGMVGGSQAFDNNSYEEVELKFYQERLAAQAEETHEPAKSALRRDSRLRRSQNHYVNVTPKQAETQRPSSLVLDLDSVQTAVQYFGDRCSERKSSAQGLSSPSNVEKTPLSPRQEQRTTGGSSERARQNKQSGFHEHAEVSKKKPPVSPRSPQTDMLPSWSDNRKSQDYMNVWMERTDSTSSQSDQQPFVTAGSGQPINLSNPGSAGGQRKSYSKIGFCDGFSQPQLSDLPPPPPPPPLTDNEEEPIDRQPPNPSDGEYLECSEAVSGIRDFGDSGSIGDKNRKEKTKQRRGGSSALQGKLKKLSVWKRNETDRDSDAEKTPSLASRWRRKSYAAACRKSQSLDHLYEQMLMESARDRHDDQFRADQVEGDAAVFSTLQHKRKPQNLSTSAVRSTDDEILSGPVLSPNLGSIGNENVFDDEFPPPPPPHILQEVLPRVEPPNGYAAMRPLGEGNGTTEKQTVQRKQRTSSEGRISSPKQPKDFSLEKTRSQLHLKTSKSENSLLSQTCLSVFESGAKQTIRPGLSSSGFEPNEASTPDSGTFDNVEADVKSGRLHRRMSEGSTGRRQKDRVGNTGELGDGLLRRRRSVSGDFASNKRKESTSRTDSSMIHFSGKSNAKHQMDKESIPILRAKQQPRFPLTNPFIGSLRNDSLGSSANTGQSPTSSPETTRATRGISVAGYAANKPRQGNNNFIASQDAKAKPSVASEEKSSLLAKSQPPQLAKGEERGRSTKKMEISGKKGKDGGSAGSKKRTSGSGGSQSRSLVDIMKSKFGRSGSGGRSSSSGKKSNTPQETKAQNSEAEKQVKPASSFIDPRTLSLEPNMYLPPGKDGYMGASKKSSKLKLGSNSDAAVGRKLSQPYPNGVSGSSTESSLSKVVEEVVSDEGFAEGSTIERQDKDTDPEANHAEPASWQDAQESSAWSPRSEPSQSKKNNRDWYENVVATVGSNMSDSQSRDEKEQKRLRIASSDAFTDVNQSGGRFAHLIPVKQKRTRCKGVNEPPYVNIEPPYENVALDGGILGTRQNPAKVEENNNVLKRLSGVSDVYQPQLPPGCDVYATGVTIIRTPQNRKLPASVASSPSRLAKPSRKPAKSVSGIGRIIKSVGIHTGSNSDLSATRDLSSQNANLKPRKQEKDGHGRKINYNAHQRVFEKVFISSVVEAELGQRPGGRGSPRGSLNDTNSGAPSPTNLQLSIASSGADNILGESVGTGSSFGSLPSDGLGDMIGCQATSSSESSEPTSKPVQQRLPKSKRDAISVLNKTGTNDSNASTSSSETNFRGRGKKTGLRAPAVSYTSNAPSHGQPRSPATNVSRPKEQKAPEYHQSPSRPPPYLEAQTRDKAVAEDWTPLHSRRSQSGTRLSRISSPSKLPATCKASEAKNVRSLSGSSQDGSGGVNSSRSPKVKLAPLNYGFPNSTDGRGSGGKKNEVGKEPIYENSSIIQQHHSYTKQISPLANQHPPKLSASRIPSSLSASKTPSPRTLVCEQNQMEPRKIKRNIPLAVGLHRPRPINPTVGVV